MKLNARELPPRKPADGDAFLFGDPFELEHVCEGLIELAEGVERIEGPITEKERLLLREPLAYLEKQLERLLDLRPPESRDAHTMLLASTLQYVTDCELPETEDARHIGGLLRELYTWEQHEFKDGVESRRAEVAEKIRSGVSLKAGRVDYKSRDASIRRRAGKGESAASIGRSLRPPLSGDRVRQIIGTKPARKKRMG